MDNDVLGRVIEAERGLQARVDEERRKAASWLDSVREGAEARSRALEQQAREAARETVRRAREAAEDEARRMIAEAACCWGRAGHPDDEFERALVLKAFGILFPEVRRDRADGKG